MAANTILRINCSDSLKLEQTTKPQIISRHRKTVFILLSVLTVIIFHKQLQLFFSLGRSSDKYTHILLIPVLSLFFLIKNRKSLAVSESLSLHALPGVIVGFLLTLCSLLLIPDNYSILRLSISMTGFLLVVYGTTFFFWGFSLFNSYRFPWLLMLLAIPLPSTLVDGLIWFFQHGSGEFVNFLLSLTGMTFIRDGLTFHLPNISIFIATECSGIRSSIALLITAVISGHLCLKTWPGKVALMLLVIPLTLLKNGIRITTLTILAQKVDVKWLTDSHLHHNGGVVFFGIVLALMIALLTVIGRIERALASKEKEVSTSSTEKPVVSG